MLHSDIAANQPVERDAEADERFTAYCVNINEISTVHSVIIIDHVDWLERTADAIYACRPDIYAMSHWRRLYRSVMNEYAFSF